MKKPIRILHLEDNPDDADLIQAVLNRSGLSCTIDVAATGERFIEALGDAEFDLILSDGSIPGFGRRAALDSARQRHPGIPFIFVTGSPAPPTGVATTESDDDIDHVPKNALERLAPTIRRSLQDSAIKAAPMPQQTYRSRTEQLIQAVQDLSRARDLNTVMEIVRQAARRLTGADGATFVLRDGDRCYYADEDAIAPLWKGKRFPMAACISGWVMLQRRPAVIEDIYADARIPADAYRPTFVKSLVMVPIRTDDPVGAIGNYWAQPYRARPEQLKLLQALADSTSIALENVRLYDDQEQRVRDRTAQLEAANRELEAFSYSVSHDLRAPLRHIDGYSQLLLEQSAGLDESGRDCLVRLRRASHRMGQLIEDLLQLSKITRTEVRKECIDLTHMAGEVAWVLQSSAPDRRVELDIQPGIGGDGDPRLLRIVLENLLANAWKYTRKQPQARIGFSMTEDADGTRVYHIRDNGVGFDMAYADRLFGAFQRLHAEAEFPGTGVGLATVQRIVHKHGGEIRAEASPGDGAHFCFTLG